MRFPSQRRNPLPLFNRRSWLRLILFGGFLSITNGQNGAQGQGVDKRAGEPATRHPEKALPQAFMERAEEMRRQAVSSGDQGYGAVVAIELPERA